MITDIVLEKDKREKIGGGGMHTCNNNSDGNRVKIARGRECSTFAQFAN